MPGKGKGKRKIKVDIEAIKKNLTQELERLQQSPDQSSVELGKDQTYSLGMQAENGRHVTQDRIKNIKNTLARMEEGTFGICVDCQHPINPDRLNAYPEVKRCADCQTVHDKRQPGGRRWK